MVKNDDRLHSALTNEDQHTTDEIETGVPIYCLDCRGRFYVDTGDIEEEEVLECPLCASEMQIDQTEPLKLVLLAVSDDWGE